MKKQSIWVFEWRQSVHYWWSYILFSPECKELTSMLDPLLYRWGVPPVVIRCVRWTMQSGVQQTWIKALGIANVMTNPRKIRSFWPQNTIFPSIFLGPIFSGAAHPQQFSDRVPPPGRVLQDGGDQSQKLNFGHCYIKAEAELRGRNYGAGKDFKVGPEFGAMRKQPISPGNSRACSCAGEEDWVMWLDRQPG